MPKKICCNYKSILEHITRQIKDSAKESRSATHLADPYKEEKAICSSSYDGSFSVSFYAYALQFYAAFSFYHKASLERFLVK